jgi:hypothetical protein
MKLRYENSAHCLTLWTIKKMGDLNDLICQFDLFGAYSFTGKH